MSFLGGYARTTAMDLHIELMSGEVLAHVDAFDFLLFAALVDDDNYFYASRPFEQRHATVRR